MIRSSTGSALALLLGLLGGALGGCGSGDAASGASPGDAADNRLGCGGCGGGATSKVEGSTPSGFDATIEGNLAEPSTGSDGSVNDDRRQGPACCCCDGAAGTSGSPAGQSPSDSGHPSVGGNLGDDGSAGMGGSSVGSTGGAGGGGQTLLTHAAGGHSAAGGSTSPGAGGNKVHDASAGDACNPGACAGGSKSDAAPPDGAALDGAATSDECSDAGSPAMLGTLQSYGSEPGLFTIVAFPTEDRAVFLTDKTLTLLRIDSDRLEILDRTEWEGSVQSLNISSTIYVARPATFIVPLSSQRIAVIGAQYGIDLYDISADRLAPSSRFTLTGSLRPVAATGRTNVIWTCIGTSVVPYLIDDANHAINMGNTFVLPQGHACHGLSLTPDGNTLLAATAKGVDFLDVSGSDGSAAMTTHALDGDYLLDAFVSGGYLGAYQLDNMLNGYGDLQILTADGVTPIASFPMAKGGITPIGFTMLPEGLLLEQSDDTGTCRHYNAALYALAAGGATASNPWRPLDACRAHYGDVPAHVVGLGHHVALEPTHQVVRIDPQSGSLIPVTGREQGSFERVRPAGPNLVEVHGPTSMHLVDISRPEAPVVKEGGLHVPVNTEWLRVELSPNGRPSPFLLTIPDSDIGFEGPRTTLYWRNEGALPTIAGSIANADGASPWAAFGDYLYQVIASGALDFEVRRVPTAGLTQAEDQQLVPDRDEIVTGDAPAALDRRLDDWFGVDPDTGDLAILEWRTSQSGTTDAASVLNWFSRTGQGYSRSFAVTLTGSPWDVALAGGKALAIFSDHAVLVGSDGTTLATFASSGVTIEHLFSFDGKIVVLGANFIDAHNRYSQVAIVLRGDDLSEVARYVTRERVLSAAQVGKYLVFGMQSTLQVASLPCALVSDNR